MDDNAFDWISKLSMLSKSNEACCYYKYIMSILLSSNQINNQVQIKQFNAKRGGFANIHYGVYNGEAIAIKEQLFDENDDKSNYLSMLREISIQIFCNNSNISKILAVHFIPQESKVWIFQQRYEMDLYEALFQKNKIIPNKQEICLQILTALDYIHSAGLAHLDIKPKNLMFDTLALEKIFILDFGITKLEKNEDTEMIGFSQYYSAPEVKPNNKSLISSKSDIFSFAIVLYELVTRKRAWPKFVGGQGPIALYNYLQGNYNFFSENQSTGNANLDKFISDCVQKDPKKRPTANEAIHRLLDIMF